MLTEVHGLYINVNILKYCDYATEKVLSVKIPLLFHKLKIKFTLLLPSIACVCLSPLSIINKFLLLITSLTFT